MNDFFIDLTAFQNQWLKRYSSANEIRRFDWVYDWTASVAIIALAILVFAGSEWSILVAKWMVSLVGVASFLFFIDCWFTDDIIEKAEDLSKPFFGKDDVKYYRALKLAIVLCDKRPKYSIHTLGLFFSGLIIVASFIWIGSLYWAAFTVVAFYLVLRTLVDGHENNWQLIRTVTPLRARKFDELKLLKQDDL